MILRNLTPKFLEYMTILIRQNHFDIQFIYAPFVSFVFHRAKLYMKQVEQEGEKMRYCQIEMKCQTTPRHKMSESAQFASHVFCSKEGDQ